MPAASSAADRRQPRLFGGRGGACGWCSRCPGGRRLRPASSFRCESRCSSRSFYLHSAVDRRRCALLISNYIAFFGHAHALNTWFVRAADLMLRINCRRRSGS